MSERRKRKSDRQGVTLPPPLSTAPHSRYYHHAPDGALVIDGAGEIIYINPSLGALIGRDVDELTGEPLDAVGLTLEGRPFAGPLLDHLTKEQRWEGELTITRPTGERSPVRMVANALSSPEGSTTEYVLFIALRPLADDRRDRLTGLPDRAEFLDLLDRETRQLLALNAPLAILLIDLDRFRDVNDTLGFTVGDNLLTAVGRRLSDQLRHDDAVARLGGDEFLLFAHLVAEAHEAAIVAQRILDSFSVPFTLGDREIFVSATLGITLFPADGDGVEGTLRRAHMALADAKRHESGGFRFYAPEMERKVALRQEIENNLMPGLERGEFDVHYQPKVSTVDGRVVGMEALIRWNSPISGNVPPARFIPLAEERGFIVPLGAWVLRKAVVQAKKWFDRGHTDLVVSVNLSGRQLANRTIVDTVKETLAASGLPPTSLELEVTETAVMGDVERALSTLGELAALGVNISLDDFGSGYSSLSYLNRLPVNRIKIDREFVKEVGETTDDSVIARAAIAMGHTLGLRVIAEGAETGAQVLFLQANGCDEIQGYYYSPPVPADQLDDMLARNGKKK